MNLARQLEAVLFFKSEPVTYSYLQKVLEVDQNTLETGLSELQNGLSSRGIVLMRTDSHIQLVTAPECSELIESVRKEELSKDIGKAGVETLAIVLYKGPVTRAEIDYIRGVNSTFILRNLLIRGLVERIANPHDQRSFVYKPSLELLAYLGITTIEELPEYEKTLSSLKAFAESAENEAEPSESPKPAEVN